jgi:3-hydroxyacyl-[acyl-carrier-protein] dehydratase
MNATEHPSITDRSRVLALIPQRPPFLFVDAITSLEPGESGEGSWHVPANDTVFDGHFPGYPILPGVLVVEHAAQIACAILGPFEVPGRMPVLAKIEECSFHGSVRPGDVVTTEVAIERRVGSFIFLSATSRVGKHKILRCRLVVSIVSSNATAAEGALR